jgi:outer membrane protein
LYYLHFSKPKQVTTITTANGKDSVVTIESPEKESEVAEATGKVLYVDIDTINQKYTYIKNQKAIIEKQGAQAEASLKTKAQALQADYIEYQKKAQAGELTQQQAMALEKGLTDKQQVLHNKNSNFLNSLFKNSKRFRKN